ncbi:MAG: helix-turn-helix transcriptional regulator [Butyrivibrio sp.]|nr:helix-turn-helix transcriptional regulator [Lachnospiraceae bacterium]MBP3199367.1 helix-turn-helix transcriptional regulator [Butyrivibrio sp.]
MEYPVINMEATGARIKLLRLERNISVAQIASFMGDVSEQAIYKWQRGQTLPTVDNLFALSRLFETSMDNIIVEYEEDDKSSSFSNYTFKILAISLKSSFAFLKYGSIG